MEHDTVKNKEAENPYIIEAKGLCYAYGDENGEEVPALHDVDLKIKKGEFVAILGHNGSGKSTFAKLCNLILTPTGGHLYVDGTDVSDPALTEDDVFDLRRKVGMVFQNPDNQLVATIVEEDVAFGPENLGLPPEEIRRRVDEALDIVNMREYARHAPHQMSGGQKQRIAIAGIIAMMPDCIIFDESTAMLDPAGRAEIMDTMEKLNREKGITVLHITHYMDEAVRADRVVVLSDGKVAMSGTPEQVFSQVELLMLLGLDVPQITQLLHMLRQKGYDVNDKILYTEPGIEALKGLLAT